MHMMITEIIRAGKKVRQCPL